MSGGGGGDGPGAPLWIISFADMISNLVIFFIVLATFASKNTETNSMPKKVLDRQPGVFGDVKDRQQAAAVSRTGMLAQHGEVASEAPSRRRGRDADALQRMVQDAGYVVKPRITAMRDGVRITIDESGSFLPGSDRLSPEGREIVAEVGRFYRLEPVEFVVEAHTDDRTYRFSPHKTDVDMTRAMAVSVAVVLAYDAGVEPPRVGIAPLGSARPLASNETAAGRATNRRIEITVRDPS